MEEISAVKFFRIFRLFLSLTSLLGFLADIFVTKWKSKQVVAKRPKNQDISVLKELAAFCAIPSHKRVVPLLGVCLEPELHFISPFVLHGSLKDLLDKTRKGSFTEQKSIGKSILSFFNSSDFSLFVCLQI